MSRAKQVAAHVGPTPCRVARRPTSRCSRRWCRRDIRLPWALLLKRVFLTDALKCPKCKGRMKILAAITKPEAIRKILDHLGIPSEAPPRTAARPRPQAELSGTADLAEVDYADPPSPEW